MKTRRKKFRIKLRKRAVELLTHMKEPFVRELLQKAQMKTISAFQTIFNPREHEPKLAIKKKRMARNRCLQQTRNPTSLPRTLKSRRNRQEVGVSTLMST